MSAKPAKSPLGTAEQSLQLQEVIEALAGDGLVDYVIGSFAFGDLSHDETMQSLELFGEHVVAPLSGGTPLAATA